MTPWSVKASPHSAFLPSNKYSSHNYCELSAVYSIICLFSLKYFSVFMADFKRHAYESALDWWHPALAIFDNFSELLLNYKHNQCCWGNLDSEPGQDIVYISSWYHKIDSFSAHRKNNTYISVNLSVWSVIKKSLHHQELWMQTIILCKIS